jgi:hypothetical protein
MNKYKVKITHVFAEVIDVSANNEEEAKNLALQELQKEDRGMKASYEATIPFEHWPVITEEKYNEMFADVQAKLEEQKEPSNIIIP